MRFLSLTLLALAPAWLACPDTAATTPLRPCANAIRFVPQQSISSVAVAGEWNGFSPDADPMVARDDGSFAIALTLEPRDYAYDLLVDGKPQLDPGNPFTRWVAGVEHSRLRVGDCRVPALEVVRFKATAEGTVEAEVQYLDGSGRAGPDLESARLLLDGAPQPGTFDPATARFTFQAEGLSRGKHALRVEAADAKGQASEHLYLPFWVEKNPFQWEEATLYFVFTDRFRNGQPANDRPIAGATPQVNFQGGDFAGVTAAIEEGYFDRLGVRALWLSPFEENPDKSFSGSDGHAYTGYHGYWPSQPRVTQSRFGSLAELRALTSAAHRKGIRVIGDLVVNHVHQDHPYFQQHKSDGWFHLSGACVCGASSCDWELRRLDCWFTEYLPDFDWRTPAMAEQFTADALWWVENADLDGFRLDAVKHVDHAAGRELAGHLNEITARTGTSYYLVGETFTGIDGRALLSQYIGPSELDGQFDFPLYWSLLDAIAKGGSLTLLDTAVRAGETEYPIEAVNAPFMGNQDVARFRSIAAGELEEDEQAQAWGENRPPESLDVEAPYLRARDAFTFLLTQPGVPLIYYGDEVGLGGAGDPDNRRLMRFGDQLTPHEAVLLATVQKLGTARAQNRGLRLGKRSTLLVSPDLYVYQRDDPTGPEGAVIAINREATPRTVRVTLQGNLAISEARPFVDALGGSTETLGGSAPVSLTLAPHSAAVFIPIR